MRRVLTAAVAGLAIGSVGLAGEPAWAEGDDIAAAGLAGFALGVAFPFVNGYDYHRSGYWYGRDRRHLRYPVAYYKWYGPAGGYVYVGPNWQQWYQNRTAVYAAPAYFVVPPKRFIYFPPVPQHFAPGGQAPAPR